jgi:hypothetical protein
MSMTCSSFVWDTMVVASIVYNGIVWSFISLVVDYTMAKCSCADQGRHGNSNVGLVFLFWNPNVRKQMGCIWQAMPIYALCPEPQLVSMS